MLKIRYTSQMKRDIKRVRSAQTTILYETDKTIKSPASAGLLFDFPLFLTSTTSHTSMCENGAVSVKFMRKNGAKAVKSMRKNGAGA